MKAIVLAAGFGTRLKPWTDYHPKALVEVGGVPMLQRVLKRLEEEGFDDVTVNTHHFADQIENFIENYQTSQKINISREEVILNTGGGVMRALDLSDSREPVLVHNVDILSDAPLKELMKIHHNSGNQISLATSYRESSRKLIFDKTNLLRGWHDEKMNVYKPPYFDAAADQHSSAFSGIYILNPETKEMLAEYSYNIVTSHNFPIIDFFLWAMDKIKIGEIKLKNLNLIDIGKPNTLHLANELLV